MVCAFGPNDVVEETNARFAVFIDDGYFTDPPEAVNIFQVS